VKLVRFGAATAAGLVAFVGVLVLTFPTDTVVRSALARVGAVGPLYLVFSRASLRPWSLRLDGVVLRRPDGSPLASVDWMTLRPSLRGLIRDRTGRPWQASMPACGGMLEAVEVADAPDPTVALAWHDIHLADCPPLAITGETLAGVAEGTANVRWLHGAEAAGDGSLTLRRATWRLGDRVPGLETLHADPAVVRWTLGGGRLTLEHIDLRGPELEASGSGSIRLATATLDASLAVAPGPEASPLVQGFLASLPLSPDVAGARSLVAAGPIRAPRLVH